MMHIPPLHCFIARPPGAADEKNPIFAVTRGDHTMDDKAAFPFGTLVGLALCTKILQEGASFGANPLILFYGSWVFEEMYLMILVFRLVANFFR